MVNTYYPGNATVTAGNNKSITLGAANADGSQAPIAAGDLVLIIQMQGAEINTTNGTAYGDGNTSTGGSGNTTTNFTAGQYEYVIATSAVPVSGGTLTVASLENTYINANYNTQGQKRFQVVRVPQYSSATLGATVTAPAWNGSTGGVVAMDVAGNLNFNSRTIDVSGKGFRGGAGRRLTGGSGTSTDFRTLSTNNANAQKGEGTAGTPAYVNHQGSLVNTGVEGYPSGSMGRGAPGNAGGGGTDGRPSANDQNSGGGGGGNLGVGGQGGNSWSSNLGVGGIGGASLSSVVSSSRLVMGGGGGAGSTNDATGTPGSGFASSGAAGGGIVMVRAGSITGTGTIDASGASANNTVANDGSGGGGAGGSILLTSAVPNGISNVLVNTSGGSGGTNTGGGSAHGPGGGGGGGVVYVNHTAVRTGSTWAGGAAGFTASNAHFGAVAGSNGAGINIGNTTIVNSASGALCLPNLTVNKTTSTASLVRNTGGSLTADYTITVTNSGGAAHGVIIQDVLPTGFTYNTLLNYDLGNAYADNGGNSTGVVGSSTNYMLPSSGQSTLNFGSLTIPSGTTVTFTFRVNIPSTVADGTYQNSVTVSYLDPTRSTATRKITPLTGGTGNTSYDTPTSTTTVSGSNYVATSSTAEDVTVNTRPAAPTATGASSCGPGTVTLTASGAPTGGSYRWYTVATGGTAISSATSSTYTTPSLSGTTTYYVSAVSSAGVESASRTAVTATITEVPSLSTVPANNLLYAYPFNGNANDALGMNNGTARNGAFLTSDRFGNTSKAYSFDGVDDHITTINSFNTTNVFSFSIWFNTTSTTGGKLLGMGGSATGSSSQYDRHIYMANNGQLYFGVYAGSHQTINTTTSYNDGKWHNVVVTLSGAGMKMYVDGVQQASNAAVTTSENFSGYLRIGYDNIGGWPAAPTSNYFKGSLDDIHVYNRELSASEVSSVYQSYSISSNSPVCAGSTIRLSAPGISGAAYTWTGPNGFTSSAQNPTIASSTYTHAGTYTLIVTVNGCASDPAYTTVVIDCPAAYSNPNVYARRALSSGRTVATVTDPDGSITSAVVTGTALPGFLTLNPTTGAITVNSGTPVSGTYTTTVRTTDARGGVSNVQVTIVINEELYQASGSAISNGGTCYQLTDAINNQQGQVWSVYTVNLNNSFEISFKANFGTIDANGADGIVFGFQRVASNPVFASGAVGQGLGFQGIQPSIGVEFDTWDNGTGVGDIAADHTNFFVNGQVGSPVKAAVPMIEGNGNVEDGKDHLIRIVWIKEINTMEVYFDGVFRTSYARDIVKDIFNNDPNVYFGYTASTGGSVNRQSICEIKHNLAPEAKDILTQKLLNTDGATILTIPAASYPTDADGTVTAFKFTSVPTTAQGVLTINGQVVEKDKVFTITGMPVIRFDPAPGNLADVEFYYTVIDNLGAEDMSPAKITIPINGVPVAKDVETTGDIMNNSKKPVPLNPLDASDPDGYVAHFRILTAPTSGTLYINGNLAVLNTNYAWADANTLTYMPSVDYKGNANFYYAVVDNEGAPSSAAGNKYVVPVQMNPLPVTLISFEAKAQQQDVVLKWATATEQDNDHFELERSRDGRTFETVNRVKGAGNSNQKLSYSYLDKNAPAGVLYYRLKQVDLDGTVSLSNIVAVEVQRVALVKATLFPNPTTGTLNLDLTQLPEAQYKIRIIGMDGRQVSQYSYGNGLAVFELQSLATGKYVVQIQGADQVQTLSFIKR
ncbi:LamG-like jellyroll fold domain-containing protein [Pontibacter sp. SGAir0037]|uniref:lectin-like domain-containing protein n=1 Tax=Pontibacter sp. SGAir0037 TaxID=2571030 RepID=UPI0010F5FEA5|nr:LamG-like jellyroll fold domain-containing protein [Pontibacter sp. SGAir0037]